MGESILDLNNNDARLFFLKEKSYCNFSLPMYYNFQPLLDELELSTIIPNTIECNNAGKIKIYTNPLSNLGISEANYLLYTNKNGKLAWRPLQLINPVAYIYLVNIITSEENWEYILGRFREFQKNPDIQCCSIPLVSEGENPRALAIKGWANFFEKESIKLSLEYECMLATDISNCYSSIYTHSIAWALHKDGRDGAKKDNHNAPEIWNAVDNIIQNISNRQTNGIPQGSVLMDFIAEIVLGYADLELSKSLEKNQALKGVYKILRYRDDYRIFTHSKPDAEKIARALSEVLSILTLQLNEGKTFLTENIVTKSQKPDKLYWRNVKKCDNLESKILQIHTLSEEYPNSGVLEKALTDYCNSIESHSAIDIDLELINSVVVDIAFRNPRTYPYVVTILGKTTGLQDEELANNTIGQIFKKFSNIPNTEYAKIWLQRLSIKNELLYDNSELKKSRICRAAGEYFESGKIKVLWKSDVFCKEITNIFNTTPIFSQQNFDDMEERPTLEEIRTFGQYSS